MFNATAVIQGIVWRSKLRKITFRWLRNIRELGDRWTGEITPGFLPRRNAISITFESPTSSQKTDVHRFSTDMAILQNFACRQKSRVANDVTPLAVT